MAGRCHESKRVSATLKNGRSVTIRSLRKDDGDALGRMHEACSERTCQTFHPYPLTYESGLEVAADEDILCFVAFSDQKEAVGYSWIRHKRDVPSLGICVRDGWQEMGIGRLLMKGAIASAQELKKEGVRLSVVKENVIGVALYKSLGFVVDGESRMIGDRHIA